MNDTERAAGQAPGWALAGLDDDGRRNPVNVAQALLSALRAGTAGRLSPELRQGIEATVYRLAGLPSVANRELPGNHVKMIRDIAEYEAARWGAELQPGPGEKG